ncbi:MAG: arylsulfatase [Verrucomicrobiota bacterium]|nr:arylsulfatase [Verrucomicrobiota bacterium]
MHCVRFACWKALTSLSAVIAGWGGLQGQESARQANVIVFLADDLGYQELGCYGQNIIKTPHIDSLAAQGIRMTHFYAGSPVCAPSRGMLLTGKHSGHAFIRDNKNPKGLDHIKQKVGWEFPGQYPIPPEEITLAEALKSKGYATGAMGKWGLGHFGTSGDPNQQGFDLFYGFNCQVHAHNHYPRFLWRNDQKEQLLGNDRTLHGETFSQDRFIEEAIGFIDKHQEDPFFLFMPFTIPHLSIQAPQTAVDAYTTTIQEETYEHRGYLKHPTPRAGYAAMVTYLDQGVGLIMKKIRALGLEKDTLVIFTSDNGPTYKRLGGSDSDYFKSAGPFKGLKGSVYEGGIRVPMVASWPGKIPAGSILEEPAAFWDLMPTILNMTGNAENMPKGIDGIDLTPWLLGKGPRKSHAYLYWEFPSYGGQQALRMGRWKTVRQKIFKTGLHTELYDLQTDPSESKNVASLYPAVVTEMEKLMSEARRPSKVYPFKNLDVPGQ